MKVGDRHNFLVATKYVGSKNGKTFFLFKCDCGNTKTIRADEVSRKGKRGTKSCGCYRNKKNREVMDAVMFKQSRHIDRELGISTVTSI